MKCLLLSNDILHSHRGGWRWGIYSTITHKKMFRQNVIGRAILVYYASTNPENAFRKTLSWVTLVMPRDSKPSSLSNKYLGKITPAVSRCNILKLRRSNSQMRCISYASKLNGGGTKTGTIHQKRWDCRCSPALTSPCYQTLLHTNPDTIALWD